MSSNKAKILVIDDEAAIRKMLRAALSDADFDLTEAESGREGVRLVATNSPDVVVLDLGLPDFDGVECIKEIRQWSHVPIIVLSARGEERSKVQALDAGAHDYVTKPFSVPELIARIRVALRLQDPNLNAQATFESSSMKINFSTREVMVRGGTIHLTPIEYKLLTLLVQHAGKVLTHRQILSKVWGPLYANQNHYLRVFMKSLRHKIEEDPARPRILITESGVGYRFKTE